MKANCILITYLLGISVIFFLPSRALSQTSNSNPAIDSIKSRIGSSGNNQETAIILSYDPLKPIYVGYYDKDGKSQKYIESARTINIDKIEFSVKDGFITDIVVYAENETLQFTNTTAPICLNYKGLGHANRLFAKENHLEFIQFADVMNYEIKSSDVPDDGRNYLLTPKNNKITLVTGVGIDNIFDLRLYTDALGLFGGTPNALAQTDLKYRHITHRKNYPNTGILWPFEYVKLNFSAEKFDSKSGHVDSASFSRSNLLQKSYLNFEVSTNIMYWWVERKSANYGYLDFGGGLNAGKLAKSKDTSSIITPDIFLEFGMNLRPSDNLGTDISLRYINQYSPQTDKSEVGSNQNQQEQFWKFGVDIFWNPSGNPSSRIFGRVNYVIAANNHMDQRNNFVQVQVGYSVLLSSLAKKAKSP